MFLFRFTFWFHFCILIPSSCLIIVQLLRSQTFRKLLLSTDITCLKNSANGQTMMHRFNMILKEWHQGNQKLMRNDMCK